MYDDFKKEELKQWVANNADVVFDDFKKQGSRFVSIYHLDGTKGSGGIVQSSVNGNLFKDFGTSEQLDGIALYMLRHNCDFKTALHCLSDISGIDVCQAITSHTNVKLRKPVQSNVASTKTPQTARKQYDFHDKQILVDTMRNYNCNILAKYLIGRFGERTAMDMLKRYYVGTAKVWSGATTFPYVDIDDNVCSVKIMLYEIANKFGIVTPHRKKDDKCQYITWGHSLLRLENFNKKPCFFGEHLLNDDANKGKPVAIVESEKTALIASEYLKTFVWVAVGGLANLNGHLKEVLKNRDVVFFPDGGSTNGKRCFDTWKEKIENLKLQGVCNSIKISEYINNHCTEEELRHGIDICDILLREELPTPQADCPATRKPTAKEEILREFIAINPLLGTMIEKFDLRLI